MKYFLLLLFSLNANAALYFNCIDQTKETEIKVAFSNKNNALVTVINGRNFSVWELNRTFVKNNKVYFQKKEVEISFESDILQVNQEDFSLNFRDRKKLNNMNCYSNVALI